MGRGDISSHSSHTGHGGGGGDSFQLQRDGLALTMAGLVIGSSFPGYPALVRLILGGCQDRLT